MAPRQSVRRLLVAASALALAAGVAACSPPNEEPSDKPASTVLPSYHEPAGSEHGISHSSSTAATSSEHATTSATPASSSSVAPTSTAH